jgi:hypothetical protein
MAEIRRQATRPPIAGLQHRNESDPNPPEIDDLQGGTGLATAESVGLAVTIAGLVQLAKARSPAVKNMPNSARTLITVGPPILWFLYSTTSSSRNSKKARVHEIHGVPGSTQSYTQAADSSAHRRDLDLSFPQRTKLFLSDNTLSAVGAIGLPLAAYGGYVHYAYPNMPFTQKVGRSQLLGQVTILTSLGLVAALANSYEPPEEAKPTLRKHMTSVRPQAGETANIVARNSKGKPTAP